MSLNKIGSYLNLLSIRKSAKQRDSYIIGGIFWISFISLVFLSLSNQLSGRSQIIVGAMVVVFGLSYMMIWVRLEMIKNMIDLVEHTREDDNQMKEPNATRRKPMI